MYSTDCKPTDASIIEQKVIWRTSSASLLELLQVIVARFRGGSIQDLMIAVGRFRLYTPDDADEWSSVYASQLAQSELAPFSFWAAC